MTSTKNIGYNPPCVRQETATSILAMAAVLAAGLALSTGPAASAPPVLITGPSPFASCDVSAQPGINYPNAEVEPWVDVDPTDTSHLIAGWQQDRFSNGGSKSLMSGYSENGGASWTSVVVPGIDICSGGTGTFAFDRASDPWVTIAPDGTAYFQSLSFNNDEPCGAGGDNALLVSKSDNGGVTWGPPQVQIFDTDGQLFNDKNSMRADPTDSTSSRVYAVWDRIQDFTLPSVCPSSTAKAAARASHGGDGVADARDRLRKAQTQGLGGPINPATIFTGPTLFTRTTDGGETWEEPRIIFDPGSNAQTINNLIEVLPNGHVIDFFTNLSTLGSGGVKLGMVKSTDHGETFGPVSNAFQMVVTNTGTLTPDARSPVRDANILFDVATDRGNGNLYVVWQDGRSRNIDTVYFSMSTNGGASWSHPVRINKTPFSSNKLRNQAFVPSVEVGANHKVVVTYYDFRNDTNDGKEATDFWAISCDIANGANCRTAGGWGSEVRLTPTSFDMLEAPVARGHFLGDYQGLVNAGGTVTAVFGKSVGVNLNDIFSTTIP
jgi:hypothetical protein